LAYFVRAVLGLPVSITAVVAGKGFKNDKCHEVRLRYEKGVATVFGVRLLRMKGKLQRQKEGVFYAARGVLTRCWCGGRPNRIAHPKPDREENLASPEFGLW
jgi:hypothetical protein